MTNSPLAPFSTALSNLAARAAPGIVSIESSRKRASGIVWKPGLIVTADEAISEDHELSVKRMGGDRVDAKIVGRDPTTDIALLRVDHPSLKPALLEPAAPAVGALALVIGSDDGETTAAFGIVSRAGASWRSMRGGEIDARIELDMRLRRSAEGGLVIDAQGRTIGMPVFGPRRRVLVIPLATIARVAAKLETHGRIARGYLGLGLQPVAIEGANHPGAMIMSVDPKGPGAAAGLHQGDVLVAWNGEPIRHVHGLLRSLGPDSVGQRVTLGLSRAGERRDVPLTIAERPAA